MRISSILDCLLTVCAALWRNKECVCVIKSRIWDSFLTRVKNYGYVENLV